MKSIIKKITIFALLASVGFIAEFRPIFAAEAGVSCQKVEFTPKTIKGSMAMALNEEGNPESFRTDIVIEVSAQFMSNNYIIAFDRGDGFAGGITLNFEDISGSPASYTGNRIYRATLKDFEINRSGTWRYALERAGGGVNSTIVGTGGAGTGCPQSDGYVSFVVAEPDYAAELEDEDNQFSVTCSSMRDNSIYGSLVNHFTCGAIAGDYFIGDDCCMAGFFADARMCTSSLDYGGSGARTLRCLSNEDKPDNLLSHLAECDPNDTKNVCDFNQGYSCESVSNPNDNASHRCLITSTDFDQKLEVGDQCYIGSATECASSIVGSLSTCQPDASTGNDYLGICKTYDDPSAVDCTDLVESDQTRLCVQVMKANNAYCNPATGKCALDAATSGGNNGGQNFATQSTQFGRRNCPGVVNDIPNANVDESVACWNCLSIEGNTWVGGIGCINTTPAGIFLQLIRIGIGIMGGVALIRLIILGYTYQFGEQKDIQAARKQVIDTLGALVIVLFSVLILRIIGVNVLDVVPTGFFGTN